MKRIIDYISDQIKSQEFRDQYSIMIFLILAVHITIKISINF